MRATFQPRYRCVLIALTIAVVTASCGGTSGGPGPTGAGQGLNLVTFEQEATDNLALNRVLRWVFSESLDAGSVDGSSIQIRSGPQFGEEAPGTFRIDDNVVTWEPHLSGLCDLAGNGLQPDTTYRVQLIGSPSAGALRNTRTQPLTETLSFEFRTRSEADPQRFRDQVPAFPPRVVATTPANGTQAVPVGPGNRIEVAISENIDPCTIDDTSVVLEMHETGDPSLASSVAAPNGRRSGFYAGTDTSDQAPGNPFSWGSSGIPVAPAQRILSDVRLVQDFASTRLIIEPDFGQFPENALLVLRLRATIQDYGGQSLTPFTLAFTTENLDVQTSTYELRAEGETPFLVDQLTADVDSIRAPSRVQGFLLFAGDGDNGADLLLPSGRHSVLGDPACAAPLQVNDGAKDDFDPESDVTLDTGASQTCTNDTDGSTAVVFEFRTLRIRNGVTVRIRGENPAILLVQGRVQIEPQGTLQVRGDGQATSPQGAGANGRTNTGGAASLGARGGTGVAGGGRGGNSVIADASAGLYGEDGVAGIGSTGAGTVGGLGAGRGNVEGRRSSFAGGAGGTPGAGGAGGHAVVGSDGSSLPGPNTPFTGPARGTGGGTYPAGGDDLRTPSAGSGGGAAGAANFTGGTGAIRDASGGAGGAGGGFVDVTASGSIEIRGTIDAAGGRGGNGTVPAGGGPWHASSGGGGGSGGALRLLTPQDIDITGATITTAGGQGGIGATGTFFGSGPRNDGGNGGNGRIVMEDADSLVTGLGSASVVPGEGGTGFFRAQFDPSRFQGGGLQPRAVTDIFAVGPLDPDYIAPVQADFAAGIPAVGSRGFNLTSLFIDARAFPMRPDGSADETAATSWHSVGWFVDSGTENLPTWVPASGGVPVPVDVAVPADNAGGTIDALDGREFIQLRFTMYLPATAGPFDPGPFLDTWRVRFSHDQ